MTGDGSLRWRLQQRVPILGSILSVATAEPVVILTYDDGPEPGQTERVMETLAEFDAHATFFMLSRRALAHPKLVDEVRNAGHEIALHGRDHRPLNQFRPREVYDRTRRAKSELEDVAQVEVRWFRPPYGKQSPRVYQAVRSCGLMPVMWTASQRDSANVTLDERLRSVERALRPGVILLAHDGRAGLDDGVDDGALRPFDRGDLARLVLEIYAGAGLRGTSLGQAMSVGTGRRGMWFA